MKEGMEFVFNSFQLVATATSGNTSSKKTNTQDLL